MCLIKAGANKATLIVKVCGKSDPHDMRQLLVFRLMSRHYYEGMILTVMDGCNLSDNNPTSILNSYKIL